MSESNQNETGATQDQSVPIIQASSPNAPVKNGQLPPLSNEEVAGSQKRVNFEVNLDEDDVENMDINQISKKYGKIMQGDHVGWISMHPRVGLTFIASNETSSRCAL